MYHFKDIEKNIENEIITYPKKLSLNNINNALNIKTIASCSLIELINNNASILLIINYDINLDLLKLITKKIRNLSKKFSIILEDIFLPNIDLKYYQYLFGDQFISDYKDNLICYSKEDISQFDFFGTSKMNIPIFIHKAYLSHKLIIPICNIKYNTIFSTLTAKEMIFPGLSPFKTLSTMNKVFFHTENISKKLPSDIINRDITNTLMITGANINWYGINYISDNFDNIIDISAGDLFLSSIKCKKLFDNYRYTVDQNTDTLIVTAKLYNYDNYIKIINIKNKIQNIKKIIILSKNNIKYSSNCNIDIRATNYYNLFYNKDIQNIFNNMLRISCKIISLSYNQINNIKDIIKTLNITELDRFLEGCKKVGYIDNADRFSS